MIPITYDRSYFMHTRGVVHPAGYSNYELRFNRDASDPNDQGEEHFTRAHRFFRRLEQHLKNRSVLDVGCARGYHVAMLRQLGVNAHGVDISQWAIENCHPQVAAFVQTQDARVFLQTLPNNAYDVAICVRTLPCFTDTELASLIPQLTRISRRQIAICDDTETYAAENQETRDRVALYYNIKTRQQWTSLLPSSFIYESASLWL